jgi:hypothetical protein
MNQRGRPTKNDILIRISTVKEKLLLGKSIDELVYFARVEFHISERRALQYIEIAERGLAGILKKDRDRWLAEHIAIRQDIRERAREGKNLRIELEAAKDEAKLLGLEPNILEIMRVVDACQKRIDDLERMVMVKHHPAEIAQELPQAISDQPITDTALGALAGDGSLRFEDLLEEDNGDDDEPIDPIDPIVDQLKNEAPDGDDVPAAG